MKQENSPEKDLDRVKEIDKKIEVIRQALDKKDKEWDYSKDYDDYMKYLEPEASELDDLLLEKEFIKKHGKLKEIPKYGHVMSLEEFIESCKSGFFIDYDGYGNYIFNNKMTDITIRPSHVEKGKVRKEFNKIIWFNR